MVSEKIWFEFLYVHDLGPRSRNDLDLQYSHTFIKSFSCLYLPTFRSQAAIVSAKSTVFIVRQRNSIFLMKRAIASIENVFVYSDRCGHSDLKSD